jgi:hypothetical protein
VRAHLLVPMPHNAHLEAAFDNKGLHPVRVRNRAFHLATDKLSTGKHDLVVAFVDRKGHRMARQRAPFVVTTKDGNGNAPGDGNTPPTSTSPKPPTTTPTTPKPPTTTPTTPKPPTTTPTTPTPPNGDTTAPTTPGALLIAGAGQMSVIVSWKAANDNVGVTGYRLTRAGAAPIAVAGLSTTISGLPCGTSITVAVVALDAAGNASTPASASGSTAACPVVVADHYVSTGGSDAGPCTQAAPCATLARAYAVSTSGQTISVAPGSYPGQTIPNDPSKGHVGFIGNGASTGEIVVQTSHVTLQGFNTGGWTASEGTTDITFDHDNVTQGEFFINSATDVSVIGGVVDGAGRYWTNGNQVKTMSSSSTVPSGILFDGVTIQNFRKNPAGSDHVDCLHVMAADGITIRNSRFANCEAFDVLFTVFLGPTPSNILIENNFFRCCGTGFYSVQLGGGHGEDFHNVTIRNNSADTSMTVGSDNSVANVAFYNNDVPGIGGCDRNGVTADYNVLFDTSAKCGPHDLLAASGFVGGGDLHLSAGAAAINAGLASQAPATDIDGQPRPQGPAPDIGADEAG